MPNQSSIHISSQREPRLYPRQRRTPARGSPSQDLSPSWDKHADANSADVSTAKGNLHKINTVMCHLTTGLHYKKSVVRQFNSCANIVECTYTNL